MYIIYVSLMIICMLLVSCMCVYVLIICLSGWFQEQDEWFQREQELLQRIDEVSEKHTKILQNERVSMTCIRQSSDSTYIGQTHHE